MGRCVARGDHGQLLGRLPRFALFLRRALRLRPRLLITLSFLRPGNPAIVPQEHARIMVRSRADGLLVTELTQQWGGWCAAQAEVPSHAPKPPCSTSQAISP